MRYKVKLRLVLRSGHPTLAFGENFPHVNVRKLTTFDQNVTIDDDGIYVATCCRFGEM